MSQDFLTSQSQSFVRSASQAKLRSRPINPATFIGGLSANAHAPSGGSWPAGDPADGFDGRQLARSDSNGNSGHGNIRNIKPFKWNIFTNGFAPNFNGNCSGFVIREFAKMRLTGPDIKGCVAIYSTGITQSDWNSGADATAGTLSSAFDVALGVGNSILVNQEAFLPDLFICIFWIGITAARAPAECAFADPTLLRMSI